MPTTVLKNVIYRFLLPFCAPGCGRNPVSGLTGHELICRSGFEKLIRKHHVLGSATLLSSGNQSTLVFTSSASPQHIARSDSFFRVASITKIATAVLTMRLVDQHLLDLDTPVGTYFESSSVSSLLDGITLRHLLSHTAGLLDPPDLESSLETGRPFTELAETARFCQPGNTFRYSNFGYGLIGCVMEAVLGMPIGEIFRKHLFEPLNMNATLEGCLLPADRIMPVSRILPYHKGQDLILTTLGSKPLSLPDPLRHYGHTAGSMYTDICSLHSLLRVLITNETHFLSDHALMEMKKKHASYGPISPTLSYGLGLLLINDSLISTSCIYGHQGFAYGCADGAFWENDTGRVLITLNGGCSEARSGRLGLANRDFMHWAFRKELPSW